MRTRCSSHECIAGFATALLFAAAPALAAHWQAIGPTDAVPSGLAYMDLDSVRDDGEYRIAQFLTIYAAAVTNARGIRIDRIAQETAFNCAAKTYSLKSTVGYNAGKPVGRSSDTGEWRQQFQPVPADSFSQQAFELACKSRPRSGPVAPSDAESPGLVNLPGPAPVN